MPLIIFKGQNLIGLIAIVPMQFNETALLFFDCDADPIATGPHDDV